MYLLIKVVITGHSLGASIASLVCVLYHAFCPFSPLSVIFVFVFPHAMVFFSQSSALLTGTNWNAYLCKIVAFRPWLVYLRCLIQFMSIPCTRECLFHRVRVWVCGCGWIRVGVQIGVVYKNDMLRMKCQFCLNTLDIFIISTNTKDI